jgi:FkbM family methyltransferase
MDYLKENFLELYEINGFQLYCIKNDTAITKIAREQNIIWENWTEDIIKELYIENTNMIDIGAHIGTTSLIMSKYISENSFIYAFEPVYNNITNLNICKNNLQDKIKLYPIGLSNKKEQLEGGLIDFSISANYGYTRIDTLNIANQKSEYIIHVDTLDNMNLENVSFIKIDVEGSESKVLEGAKETINKYKPTIFIELWCTSENSKKLIEKGKFDYNNPLDSFVILYNLGYVCFPISVNSDDFLFIHYTNKCLIEKFITFLNKDNF